MPRAELKIPKGHKSAFRLVADADPEKLQAILSALRGLEHTMDVHRSAQALSQKSGLDIGEARGLLVMVASLFSLTERPGRTSAQLQSELLSVAESDKDLTVSGGRRDQLAKFLREVLSLDNTLGVLCKAWSVIGEAEHSYSYSRVLTDLRPVFRPDSDEVSAFVVLHHLKLAYHIGSELREFFLTMSTDDIRELLEVLQRAERKYASLKPVARSTELPVLEAE